MLCSFASANNISNTNTESANSVVTFEQCQSQLHQRAIEQGYSTNITDIIDNLSPIERVLSLDTTQPEFAQSFGQYVSKRVSHYHVNKGREKLKSHRVLLKKLQKQYGIAPQYLVSFWGLETVFGRHKGKMSVLNSIATLACDKRRSEYFTSELFDLLYLIDTNMVTVSQLQGSWAGAMGHMQFMPSAYRLYATDGDNDGKIDVWQSEADAITTAANYLNKIGWKANERWGREVQLPNNFDFSSIEFDTKYPLTRFAKLGVTQKNGQPLPVYNTQAELILPNGYHGKAFLVYGNFDKIMKWNLSKNYALSVGILADKLIGAAGVSSLINAKPLSFSRTQMEKLQSQLNAQGYDSGKPDGIWGPNSRKAIREFQIKHQLVADGFPNKEVFELLGIQQS